MSRIDWPALALVIFDVDGTLYDQRLLRRRMLGELAVHCLTHPWKWRVLPIIAEFRRCREELAENEAEGIIDRQYTLPAERLRVDPQRVRQVVEEWMEERPLPLLRACRQPDVGRFMDELRRAGKRLAVFSDYPTGRKLSALGLEVELQVSALDPEVDRLKPHPRGLERILELAGVHSSQALLIGDRADRDGACARRASVPCLIRVDSDVGSPETFGDFATLGASLSTGTAEKIALQ